MNLLLKISGAVLLIIGFTLVIKPDLFGKFPTAIDGYQMIEKRIKWGILIGFGVFLIFNHTWNSWGLVAAAVLTALTFGIILSRLIGFVLDGFFIKQLWWLLIEFVALILFALLYWKQK